MLHFGMGSISARFPPADVSDVHTSRSRLHNLSHRTAHIDIYNVREIRPLQDQVQRLTHHHARVSEELEGQRPFLFTKLKVSPSPLVSILQPVGTDHLCHDETSPVTFHVEPEGALGYTGHGSQNNPVSYLHVPDGERSRQRTGHRTS